jgi:hypothetical protein
VDLKTQKFFKKSVVKLTKIAIFWGKFSRIFNINIEKKKPCIQCSKALSHSHSNHHFLDVKICQNAKNKNKKGIFSHNIPIFFLKLSTLETKNLSPHLEIDFNLTTF